MSIDYRPDNTIIFTIARMNPPTPGHLNVIQKLIEEGIEKNAERVYVILSKTIDNKENPIPCPEKINVLGTPVDISKTMINAIKERMKLNTKDEERKGKIDNIIVETICVPEEKGATPFKTLFYIVQQKNDIPDLNLFLVVGNDRSDMLDSIKETMIKRPNVNSVDGYVLERPDMKEFKELSSDPEILRTLDMSKVPEPAMSASFVRNLVNYDMKDKFFDLYLPYLDEEKIENLYNHVKSGLNLPPKPLEPRIKTGIKRKLESKNVGGKKTKKRKNKKTKRIKKLNKYKKLTKKYNKL